MFQSLKMNDVSRRELLVIPFLFFTPYTHLMEDLPSFYCCCYLTIHVFHFRQFFSSRTRFRYVQQEHDFNFL